MYEVSLCNASYESCINILIRYASATIYASYLYATYLSDSIHNFSALLWSPCSALLRSDMISTLWSYCSNLIWYFLSYPLAPIQSNYSDLIWSDLIWYDMILFNLIWSDITCLLIFDPFTPIFSDILYSDNSSTTKSSWLLALPCSSLFTPFPGTSIFIKTISY